MSRSGISYSSPVQQEGMTPRKQGSGTGYVDPGVFSAAEGLLSFPSPSPSGKSASSRNDDCNWLNSPFSQLDDISPGSTMNLSSTYSPLLHFSPFPLTINSNDGRTPIDSFSASKSNASRERRELASSLGIGSPIGKNYKPTSRRLPKGLFNDDESLTTSTVEDHQNAFSSDKNSNAMLRGGDMPTYNPISFDQVSQETENMSLPPVFENRSSSTVSRGLTATSAVTMNENKRETRNFRTSSRPQITTRNMSTPDSDLSKTNNNQSNNLSTDHYINDNLSTNNTIKNQTNSSNNKSTTSSGINTDSFQSPNMIIRGQQPPAKISPAFPDENNRQCNCKMSKCLKLYCECFQVKRYCHDTCRCLDCNNRSEYEEIRQNAIRSTKDRNMLAFQSKVSTSKGHSSGCNCKKSQCLKKYCECFEGSVFCHDLCKCKACANYVGSEALIKLHEDREKKSIPFKDKKRKSQEEEYEDPSTTTTTTTTTSDHLTLTLHQGPPLPPPQSRGSIQHNNNNNNNAKILRLTNNNATTTTNSNSYKRRNISSSSKHSDDAEDSMSSSPETTSASHQQLQQQSTIGYGNNNININNNNKSNNINSNNINDPYSRSTQHQSHHGKNLRQRHRHPNKYSHGDDEEEEEEEQDENEEVLEKSPESRSYNHSQLTHIPQPPPQHSQQQQQQQQQRNNINHNYQHSYPPQQGYQRVVEPQRGGLDTTEAHAWPKSFSLQNFSSPPLRPVIEGSGSGSSSGSVNATYHENSNLSDSNLSDNSQDNMEFIDLPPSKHITSLNNNHRSRQLPLDRKIKADNYSHPISANIPIKNEIPLDFQSPVMRSPPLPSGSPPPRLSASLQFKLGMAGAPIYPFFGEDNPFTTKLIALKVLEHLDNRNMYSASLVNQLWCSIALDDALWE